MSHQGWGNKNVLLAVLLIIMILGILGLTQYASYQSKNWESGLEKDKDVPSSEKNETPTSSQTTSTPKEKCQGTYYGETEGTLWNGVQYHFQTTVELKEDGTYQESNNGVELHTGRYLINENTLTVIYKKEVVGPGEEDTTFTSSNYIIKEDCSTILWTDGGDIQYLLTQQK